MIPSLSYRLWAALRCLRGDVIPRRPLPARRQSFNQKFELGSFRWYVTWSHYPDGSPAEVFLSTAKTGEMLRWMASDAAIATSLALQYGAPAEVLRAALVRGEGGEALSPLSMALDYATGVRTDSSASSNK